MTATVRLTCERDGCDRVAIYNLRWVDDAAGVSLCAAHCNDALDARGHGHVGAIAEHLRIREPLETIGRAVSVRTPYAFGDWPPLEGLDR